ncbi:hypothetical protein M758_2G154000 [Ceratodon purpureus]|nr:hypothetical protein M758_2G154000 [Ceratodon purpureus]
MSCLYRLFGLLLLATFTDPLYSFNVTSLVVVSIIFSMNASIDSRRGSNHCPAYTSSA